LPVQQRCFPCRDGLGRPLIHSRQIHCISWGMLIWARWSFNQFRLQNCVSGDLDRIVVRSNCRAYVLAFCLQPARRLLITTEPSSILFRTFVGFLTLVQLIGKVRYSSSIALTYLFFWSRILEILRSGDRQPLMSQSSAGHCTITHIPRAS